MKEITAKELKEKLDKKEDMQLVDIRENHERDIVNIGGDHIPMDEVFFSLDKIAKDKPVVMFCRTGNRSAAVVAELAKRHGFDNVYNLKGGIHAYSEEVDPTVTKY